MNEEKAPNSFRDDCEVFVGENADHYIAEFKKLEDGTLWVSWNWYAFLFAGAWLLYRKMYVVFAIYFVVDLAGSFVFILLSVTNGTPLLEYLWRLIAMCGVGLLGTKLFHDHVRHTVDDIRRDYPDDVEAMVQLTRKGGTSYYSVIIVSVLLQVAVGSIKMLW